MLARLAAKDAFRCTKGMMKRKVGAHDKMRWHAQKTHGGVFCEYPSADVEI